MIMNTKWLEWATRLQSIAQAGLTFGENQYDLDRYQQIRNISVEIMHEYSGVSHEKVKELFASETGYQTPKVDIRASVFKDNMILMVREKVDGSWSLPGGWADVNTSVSEGAVRECLEEAGAKVTPKRVIAIHTANRHCDFLYPYTIYKVIVECDLVEINFTKNTETMEAGFFPLNSLPPLSTERNTMDQIKLCFEARHHSVYEADFD